MLKIGLNLHQIQWFAIRRRPESLKSLKSMATTVTTAVLILGALSACGEKAASGEQVGIPSVEVTCASAQCQTNHTATPAMVVIYTSSGCSSPDFGGAVTGSATSVTCNGSTCTAQVSSWRDLQGNSVSTIGSNTYSICAWMSHDGSLPGENAGNSKGVLDNVTVTSSAGGQTVTSWTDL